MCKILIKTHKSDIMATEKKTTKREMNKNVPIMQVSFMYLLKISAVKRIKISVTTIVKIRQK